MLQQIPTGGLQNIRCQVSTYLVILVIIAPMSACDGKGLSPDRHDGEGAHAFNRTFLADDASAMAAELASRGGGHAEGGAD